MLMALKSLRKAAQEEKRQGAPSVWHPKTLQVGDAIIYLTYYPLRDHIVLDVQSAPFPDWIYDLFWHNTKEEFDKQKTRCSDSISAKNDAEVVARVNLLVGKTLRKRERVFLLADLRKRLHELPVEVVKKWNEEAKASGVLLAGGFESMNLKQVKVLAAWLNAKIKTLNAPIKNVAESIVTILLEEDPPEEEEIIDPRELVRSIGLGYNDDEFTFEAHQDRFAGRYPTGTWRYYVSWKKLLRKGRPVYLGSIRQIERDVRYPTMPVHNEGKWYIDNVPTVTRTRTPRGVRWKKDARQQFVTRGGYGAVRFRAMPQTNTKYFGTRAEAAGYLASLILPHRHLKAIESSSSAQ
jgi:hypothetical protein